MIQTANPIVLDRLGRDLRAHYGKRLDRALLYGSRARGDARTDSDYDVAVFLEPLESRWEEMGALAALSVRWFDDTGALVNARPYRAEWYDQSSSLMREIRKDGVAL